MNFGFQTEKCSAFSQTKNIEKWTRNYALYSPILTAIAGAEVLIQLRGEIQTRSRIIELSFDNKKENAEVQFFSSLVILSSQTSIMVSKSTQTLDAILQKNEKIKEVLYFPKENF